jgi:hypothetical protein
MARESCIATAESNDIGTPAGAHDALMCDKVRLTAPRCSGLLPPYTSITFTVNAGISLRRQSLALTRHVASLRTHFDERCVSCDTSNARARATVGNAVRGIF